ncbi:MAG: glycosyl hydrolase family 28-related protein, partial [Mycobacterium sp.]|nr:glycosyl hydrolase family 28-related protein [Mycobacterium sp.]
MRVSRRALLAGAGVAAAAAALPGCQRGRGVVDVRAFGARGDGVTDDSRAIQAAAAALRPHHTLYFPRGTYRFAQRRPSGDAAIALAGVSDVAVEFDPAAELVMDNLDPTTNTGTGHGLLVRGPASRIALRRVNIRWAADAQRSLGDGIRVLGSPGGDAPVAGISLADCVVRASPQAGVIMMGVSDIAVTGLQVIDSKADGLHFNACRHARVDDYRAVNTGDDGLALVTYFSREPAFDTESATFSF